jgi:hypothetical protein
MDCINQIFILLSNLLDFLKVYYSHYYLSIILISINLIINILKYFSKKILISLIFIT